MAASRCRQPCCRLCSPNCRRPKMRTERKEGSRNERDKRTNRDRINSALLRQAWTESESRVLVLDHNSRQMPRLQLREIRCWSRCGGQQTVKKRVADAKLNGDPLSERPCARTAPTG